MTRLIHGIKDRAIRMSGNPSMHVNDASNLRKVWKAPRSGILWAALMDSQSPGPRKSSTVTSHDGHKETMLEVDTLYFPDLGSC